MDRWSLIVILSLLACGKEPRAVLTPERQNPDGDVVLTSRDTGASSPSREPSKGKTLRLIEHRGPAEALWTYRVVEPDDASSHTPLVVALHGRGDTAESFMQLARRLELEARFIVPDGPMPFGLAGGRQWFDMASAEVESQVSQRLRELDTFVASLAVRYPEAAGIILLGFSQGAAMVLEAARQTPSRYEAVVALSGFGVSQGGQGGERPTVLVVAGTRDSIVPQERSWEAAAALEALGRRVERFSFAGPHSVTPVVIAAVRRFVGDVLEGLRTKASTP